MKARTFPACALMALVFAVVTAEAQLTVPTPQPVVGARQPALSPDGKRLAFVYRGDVWTAPSAGGRATALTSHVESDAYPVFSPDGQWIAFASERNGGWNIFVAPADGGPVQQITWHAGPELPGGWSPDGRRLLFGARREAPNYALYAVDLKTLATERLCEDYAQMHSPAFSPDGKTVVYGRYGLPWTRPRYIGSAASQIWTLNPADGRRRPLTNDERQHLWTQFLPDGKRLLTVTIGETTPSASALNVSVGKITDSPARTPNLWLYDIEGRGRQLTQFSGGAVRWPGVAGRSGDIAFEYGPDLYLLKSGSKTPAKIKLVVSSDEKQTTRRREKLTSGATEAELSPDGKTLAFGLRGDIWTVAMEKTKGVAGRSEEFARRLTEWVGDDSDFIWSRDGKKLYFTSDREFNTRIYEMDMASLAVKPLWPRDENVTHLSLCPDGHHLAFWVAGREGGLFTLHVADGVVKRVVHVPGAHWQVSGGGDFAWSPDMRWIAYTRKGESRAWNIWIVPAAGGEAQNVTRLNAHHGQPTWSPDGKYLFFQSDRDGNGLYVLPLQPESARMADTDLKFEKPKDKVKVEIDFTDIQRRIRKLASQNPAADLLVTADGTIAFLSEGDVWTVTYDGKETKRQTSGGGKTGLRALAESKAALYVQNSEVWKFKLGDSKGPEKVSFRADFDRDVKAERKAAFTQFWRSYQQNFYDPNFHGRDWEAIRKRYEPLLDAVETNYDFSTLLGMMIGELEASHSEVSPASAGVPEPVTPQLGFTFDYQHAGPGIRVAEVPPGAPGSYKQTRINTGDYVLAINGQDVSLNERLYQLINDRQDREFEFLVNKEPKKEGARKVKYRVLTTADWNSLTYQSRIERLRKYVEAQSGGKLGYLHISAMVGENQTRFEREAYEYMSGKQGMIIDVRFNGGGNISDTLIDWLKRRQHGWYRPRDEGPEAAPNRSWEKPVVVLMNEHSYSNSEMFPYAMRQRGIAKIVGMPTPGYVIWTWSMRLTDGTGARMPQGGVFRMDGSNMENNGEQPDVRVWLTPEDWVSRRDPQLDKAIELLLPPEKAASK
ncbi:MAG: S41 family peptidase [Limisphaerales bacterium]